MIKPTLNALFMLAVLTLGGCVYPGPKENDAAYAPPEEDDYVKPRVSGGGLYQQSYNWGLMQDRRAYRVGDILTVQLEESTQSSKQAKTRFGKKSDTEAGVKSLFGLNTKNLNASVSADRDFNGGANSSQQNMLRGSITVSVHKVMSNGVLVVRGEKWLTLNQGDEYIRVSGLVRVEDIQRDNTISSQRIGNARISYSGRGALSDANSAGWLTRLFNHPFFPI